MDVPIKNLGGNFIMFLPMGIYLPYFFSRLNKISMFSISMVMVLFVIEVMQLVMRRGSFDIDDFILNMCGALIGFAMWKTKTVQKMNLKFLVK
nr:VanZ family protein [Pontibacillus litoralis]